MLDSAFSVPHPIGPGGAMQLFRRRKELFDVASGVVNGKEITYSFTRPVPEDVAKREFSNASKRGLPSGSVIVIP
jgi:hypothetical protein